MVDVARRTGTKARNRHAISRTNVTRWCSTGNLRTGVDTASTEQALAPAILVGARRRCLFSRFSATVSAQNWVGTVDEGDKREHERCDEPTHDRL
jgi:hypothetical protein